MFTMTTGGASLGLQLTRLGPVVPIAVAVDHVVQTVAKVAAATIELAAVSEAVSQVSGGSHGEPPRPPTSHPADDAVAEDEREEEDEDMVIVESTAAGTSEDSAAGHIAVPEGARALMAIEEELQTKHAGVRLRVLARETDLDVEAVARFAMRVEGWDEAPAQMSTSVGGSGGGGSTATLNDGLQCVGPGGESGALIKAQLVTMIQTEMAYSRVVFSAERAEELAGEILLWFEPAELRAYRSSEPGDFVWSKATFEQGVLLLDDTRIGLLVIEDED